MLFIFFEITVSDMLNSFIGAFFGGLFTLLAAVYVLKIQLSENNANEKKKYKPYLFSTTLAKESDKQKSRIVFFNSPNYDTLQDVDKRVLRGKIFNSSESSTIIKAILINDTEYKAQANKFIDKSMLIDLMIELDMKSFPNEEYYTNSILVVSDLFGNEYKYKIKVNSSNNQIEDIFEV